MRGASGPGDSAPRAGRRRRLCVQAAALLLVLGWPVCGSEDSEGRVAARDPGLDRRGAAVHTPGGAVKVMNVGALRPHERLLSVVRDANISLGQVTPQDAGSDAKTQTPRTSQRQPGRQRRGLQSSALRMLNDLARLFLPRAATLPRVHAEFQSQGRGAGHRPGGWAETYICLLHRAQQNLRAERLRQEALERTEQGDAQRELSTCQSHLSQIQENLIRATQDKSAIGQSLRAWQRREEQMRGLSTESLSDSQAKEASESAANVKRLQADRLRIETHVRGLQVLNVVASVPCPRQCVCIVAHCDVIHYVLSLHLDKLHMGCAGSGKAGSDTVCPDGMARSAGGEGRIAS